MTGDGPPRWRLPLRRRITRRIYRTATWLDSIHPGRAIPPDRPGNVAMIHAGRCGSTVLAWMLERHPRVFWDHEIYTPVRGLWRGQMDPGAFLERRLRRAGRRWYGCEVKYEHTALMGRDAAAIVGFLEDHGITRFIGLIRRNTLRSVVSRTVRWHGGPNHLRSGATAERRPVIVGIDRVGFPPYDCALVDLLDRVAADHETVVQSCAGRPFLELTYEDDIRDDPRTGYRRICAFLDLAPADERVPLEPTNPFPLREIIENFDEVAGALGGTRHEWMLED